MISSSPSYNANGALFQMTGLHSAYYTSRVWKVKQKVSYTAVLCILLLSFIEIPLP